MLRGEAGGSTGSGEISFIKNYLAEIFFLHCLLALPTFASNCRFWFEAEIHGQQHFVVGSSTGTEDCSIIYFAPLSLRRPWNGDVYPSSDETGISFSSKLAAHPFHQ